MTQNEGPIASRLRSRSKTECTGGIDANNQSVTHRKQELKNQHAVKCTKASSDYRTRQNSKNQEQNIKGSVGNKNKPSSTDVRKETAKKTEKTIPQQKQAKKSEKEHMVYRIRWKGFDKTSECWNCALCEKDIEHFPNEEQLKHEEENELQYDYLLPETAVFCCGHVFHSICLSATQLTDPPCPMCLSLTLL